MAVINPQESLTIEWTQSLSLICSAFCSRILGLLQYTSKAAFLPLTFPEYFPPSISLHDISLEKEVERNMSAYFSLFIITHVKQLKHASFHCFVILFHKDNTINNSPNLESTEYYRNRENTSHNKNNMTNTGLGLCRKIQIKCACKINTDQCKTSFS